MIGSKKWVVLLDLKDNHSSIIAKTLMQTTSGSIMMTSATILRFRNQYLQQANVQDLDWPSPELLRLEKNQQDLWKGIFSPDALQFPPPERYETRVLKELVKRIESSLVDPDEDVGFPVASSSLSGFAVLFASDFSLSYLGLC